MPQNQEENQSFLELLLTLIMEITRSDIDPTWDSVSSSIWHASFVIQRDRQSAGFGAESVVMKQAMEVSQKDCNTNSG